MTSDEILDLLRRTGALVEGHYLARNGTHTGRMIRVNKAVQFAPFNRKLCYEIVRHFLELDIHVVVAASVAAIPVAVEVGRQLEARAIFVERDDEGVRLPNGFELHDGERVVLLQSCLRQDEELTEIIAMIRRSNARLVGIGSIVDARPRKQKFIVKDIASIQIPWEEFPADSCPLCQAGVPLGSA